MPARDLLRRNSYFMFIFLSLSASLSLPRALFLSTSLAVQVIPPVKTVCTKKPESVVLTDRASDCVLRPPCSSKTTRPNKRFRRRNTAICIEGLAVRDCGTPKPIRSSLRPVPPLYYANPDFRLLNGSLTKETLLSKQFRTDVGLSPLLVVNYARSMEPPTNPRMH